MLQLLNSYVIFVWLRNVPPQEIRQFSSGVATKSFNIRLREMHEFLSELDLHVKTSRNFGKYKIVLQKYKKFKIHEN